MDAFLTSAVRIESNQPRSPRVAQTRYVETPSAEYLANVPPRPRVSSFGRGKIPGRMSGSAIAASADKFRQGYPNRTAASIPAQDNGRLDIFLAGSQSVFVFLLDPRNTSAPSRCTGCRSLNPCQPSGWSLESRSAIRFHLA